jgi:hypothetical protein
MARRELRQRWLPANSVLQRRIGYPLNRRAGVRRYYTSFSYQAQSWNKPRRVVAKVEWHPGALYPRVGFIVSNLARSAERVVALYNQRGTVERWIKEDKGAIKWTRLSCRTLQKPGNLGNICLKASGWRDSDTAHSDAFPSSGITRKMDSKLRRFMPENQSTVR